MLRSLNHHLGRQSVKERSNEFELQGPESVNRKATTNDILDAFPVTYVAATVHHAANAHGLAADQVTITNVTSSTTASHTKSLNNNIAEHSTRVLKY